MNKPETATISQQEKTIATDDTAATLHDTTTSAVQANISQSFMLLKSGTAKKLGKQAEGSIGYRILSDIARKSIFLTITRNDGGGYFSREVVPFHKVEACIDKREQDKPFPSKLFKDAFVGRSSNNAGFMAAILRHEKLLTSSPEVETQHLMASDWTAWQAAQLKLPGELLDLHAPTSPLDGVSNAPESTDVPSEKTPEPSPSDAPSKKALTHRKNV